MAEDDPAVGAGLNQVTLYILVERDYTPKDKIEKVYYLSTTKRGSGSV